MFAKSVKYPLEAVLNFDNKTHTNITYEVPKSTTALMSPKHILNCIDDFMLDEGFFSQKLFYFQTFCIVCLQNWVRPPRDQKQQNKVPDNFNKIY